MSKFTVGQEGVKTRDGSDVRIVCVDAPGIYPIIYIAGVFVLYATAEGKYNFDGPNSQYDLILPKRVVKETLYVNVYKHTLYIYRDKDTAETCAMINCLKVAHPVTIEVEV